MRKVLQSGVTLLFLSLAVAGCSTEEIPLASSKTIVITGKVFKGLVRSTTVTAYELNPDRSKGRELARHTTDLPEDGLEPGAFKITVDGYQGDLWIEASGEASYFIDEASEKEIHFTAGDSLSVLLPQPGEHELSVTISPLTEFARRYASCPLQKNIPFAEAHAASVKYVQKLFAVNDIVALEPVSLTSQTGPTLRADQNYALALAALSQDAQERSGPGTVMGLIKQLAFDFEDCKADGMAGTKALLVGKSTLPVDYYSYALPNAAVAFSAARNIDTAPALNYASLLIKQKATISGSVTLGAIDNASVTASVLNPDGSLGKTLGTTATKADGTFLLSLSAYWGPVLLTTSAGSYVEEANGRHVTLPQSAQLHTIIPLVTIAQNISPIAISPLSEWAYRSFACSPGNSIGERWLSSSDVVANFFGVPNFQRVLPIDLTLEGTNGSVTTAHRHGLLNAAISQLATTISEEAALAQPITAYQLVQRIGDDFSDCSINSQQENTRITIGDYAFNKDTLRVDLALAGSAFINSENNASSLDYFAFKDAIAALGGNIKGAVSGQVFKGLASNYEVVATDWRGWVNHGEVAQAEANSDAFDLEILNFYGPLKLTAQGASATYLDEELQSSVSFGGKNLSALIDNFHNGERMHYIISPLSDFAFTLAACYVRKGMVPENQAFAQANTVIGAHFGIADFYTTRPNDLSESRYAGSVSDSDRFAMALAGLSRLAQDINEKSGVAESAYLSSIDLAAMLSSDLANDCMWDGMGQGNQPIVFGSYSFSANTTRLELAEALSTWMRSGKNESGIPVSEAHTYARFLSESGSSLFPGAPSLLFDNQAPILTFSLPMGAWVAGPMNFTVIAADTTTVSQLGVTGPASLTSLIDYNPDPAALAFTIATETLDDGPNVLWIQSEDTKGNSTVTAFPFNVDNQIPVITVESFRTNHAETDLSGTWNAPSGVTWLTVKHQQSNVVYGVSVAENNFTGKVELPDEGMNWFDIHLRNGANSSMTVSVAITRDTQGPKISLNEGTHQGYLGAQVFGEAEFSSGNFLFHARYPTASTAFEYLDTQFAWAITDAFGAVATISKKLLKNGVLVQAADTELSYLGSSVFGNDIHRSISSGANPTIWTMRVTAADDLGNLTQRDYSFIVRVHPPVKVTADIRGDDCDEKTGAFLRDYDFTCGGFFLNGEVYSRVDWLEGGPTVAGIWVNSKISIMMVEIENEATDIDIVVDPQAYAADYLMDFSIKEIAYSDWDFWVDSQTFGGALKGCTSAPYRDPQYDYEGTFKACQNWSGYNRETALTTVPFTAAVSLVVTNADDSVISSVESYSIPPGARRRIYLQIASPLYGKVLVINRVCKDVGYGNNGHSYWGHLQHIWRDLTYTNGSNVWTYKKYEGCKVSTGLTISYNAGKDGQAYRAAVSTDFEVGLRDEFNSNVELPYFNFTMSLAAD